MIPVLAVPVLDRYDLLTKMEDSVDTQVRRYYVIDNGDRYAGPTESMAGHADAVHVCKPGTNLGYGGAINLAIRANVAASWWLFSNDDIAFAPGHLDALAERMWEAVNPTIAFVHGFSAFAVNDKAIDRIGWFDESYHPAYCEDCDFDWRARQLGVDRITVPGATTHGGSQTIGGNLNRRQSNNRTYGRNVDYHRAKWGGEPWQETFTTPWNNGSDLSTVTMPTLARLREQAW